MSDSPCHHECDFTDGDDPASDYGCCGPIPVRKDCGAPTLPESECGDTATLEFDEETETYFALSNLYDSTCSALTDSAASTLTALVA